MRWDTTIPKVIPSLVFDIVAYVEEVFAFRDADHDDVPLFQSLDV